MIGLSKALFVALLGATLLALAVYLSFFYQRRIERHEVRKVGEDFLHAVIAGDDERARQFLIEEMRENCDLAEILSPVRWQLNVKDERGELLQVNGVQVIRIDKNSATSRTGFISRDPGRGGDGLPLEYTKEGNDWRISATFPEAPTDRYGCFRPGQ